MADKFAHSNFAVTTLREAIGPTDTLLQINVGDVSRFPTLTTGVKFPLILADSNDNLEIVYVTALDVTGVATVERGQESTTALSWLAGTIARHGYTAASIVGAAGFTPKGTWASGTQYQTNDVVVHNGISYLAVSPSLGSAPPGATWQVIYQPPTTGGEVLTYRGRFASGTLYTAGSLVEFRGRLWESLQSLNLGNTPVLGSTWWRPVARWSGAGNYHPILLASGTNNLVLAPNENEAPIDWFDGLTFRFKAATANTSNCTLAAASGAGTLAAKPLRWASGQELIAGYLVPEEVYEATYFLGTDECLLVESPSLKQLRDIVADVGVRPGTVVDFAGSAAPTGWLLCFGQEVSQTTYARLFAAISTTYNTGGEAAGNFRLPDCRGRATVGVDNMGGVAAGRLTGYLLGSVGGLQSHTLTVAEIPPHLHANTATTTVDQGVLSASGGCSVTGTGTVFGSYAEPQFSNILVTVGPAPINVCTGVVSSPITSSGTISLSGGATVTVPAHNPTAVTTMANANAGGGAAHNNVQPSIAFNKIIKT